jgi:hypothetical protein
MTARSMTKWTHPALRAAAALLAAFGAAHAAGAQSVDTSILAAHARLLAHDTLTGRANGTPGQQRAAMYIETRLRAIGLEPAGDAGTFRQPIPLTRVEIDRARTRLLIRRNGADSAFGPGAVEHLGGDSITFRSFRGDAVFAGSTVAALQRVRALKDIAGRVMVVTAGPPGSANALADSLAARGALGLVVVVPQQEALARLANARGRTRFFLRTGTSAGVRLPVLAAEPAVGAALGVERAAQSLSDASPLAPLRAVLDFRFVATFAPVRAENIVARLPGRDPARAREAVVLLAHYDHIGVAAPVMGDSIYNGFIDNAVGTSAVLAVAEALREVRLERSLVFLLTAAEEEGSLGSAHYVAHPAVPLDRTVAAINLDGGAPLAPPRSWYLEGGGGSSLDSAARRVAAREGWTVNSGPARFSSDQWRFHQRGVASTLLVPGEGWEGLTPDQETRLIERWWRAHRPDDEWEPGFPWAGLQRYAQLALLLIRDLAGSVSAR